MHCIDIVSESDANQCHQIIVHHFASVILMHCIEEFNASNVILGPALLSQCNAIQAQYNVMPMHASHQSHCCQHTTFGQKPQEPLEQQDSGGIK
jgi:hypothetical protein